MKKFFSILLSGMMIISLAVSTFATSMSVDEAEEVLLNIENGVADAASVEVSGLEINAKAAVLMEKSTGKVLYSKNENEQLYPASVTKIMTILLVCEALDSGKITLADSVSCSDNASSKGGSQIWLEPGETMTVDELLKATCVYSANDACTLLGEYISGSESGFVSLMNERAKELGMTNTHFDNCTGLDDTTDTHLTTAYDIALMSRELLRHDSVKKYTTIWMDSLRNGETQLVNTNKLVRYYNGITGLKTGTTDKAGCCISASAERDSMELIAVVMGCENSKERFSSAQELLDWGFANYEIIKPSVDIAMIHPVKVAHGKEESVNVIVPELSPVLINKGSGGDITTEIELPDATEAPVELYGVLGKVTVKNGGNVLAEYDIKAECAVEEITFASAMLKILTSFKTKE